jgi:hypothetical protein
MKSVEEYFNVPPYSSKWGLELPNNLDEDTPLFFTYPIDTLCYWGKCTFCRYQGQKCTHRSRERFDFEFANVAPGRDKIVWLQTNCLTPSNIKKILPILPYNDDIFYSSFIRGTDSEADALEETLYKCQQQGIDTSKIKLCMGIEFPSNRMLKWLNKGVNADEMLKTLHVAHKYNTPMTVYFILGWPNLIEQDIHDVEDFVSKMPKSTINDQKIFQISPTVNTVLYDTLIDKEKLIEMSSGPFHCSYCLSLNDKELEMNERARNLIVNNGYFTVDRYDLGKPIEHEWSE